MGDFIKLDLQKVGFEFMDWSLLVEDDIFKTNNIDIYEICWLQFTMIGITPCPVLNIFT